MSEGLNRNLGGYYSCLEIGSVKDNDDDSGSNFHGQYCLVRHSISLDVGLPAGGGRPEATLGLLESGNERGVIKPLLPPQANATFSTPFAQVGTDTHIEVC